MNALNFFKTKNKIIVVLLALCLLIGCKPTFDNKTNNSDVIEENIISEQKVETIPGNKDDKKEDDKKEPADERDDDTVQTDTREENNSQEDNSQEDDSQEGTPSNNKSENDRTESDSENDDQHSGNDNIVSSPETETNTSPTTDPYVGMTKAEFYANYKPATSLADARYRSQHGFLSGSLEVPGQYAQDAPYRPMENGKYVRNIGNHYADNGDTYIVVDSRGNEVMRIYKGGAYITLEEVAAYMYAFGGSTNNIPANYTSSKKTKPTSSMWGEYLRVNHSHFIGNTDRYPYEPELPNISGCGGDLQYWELDIGTTGTSTPGYRPKLYNNGTSIERGAARLVYARQDLNRNGSYEQNEVYVFYTHNHYNDFREYLNYYGGWGEMFGNVTGGGEYSSNTNCNPTPYVPTSYRIFSRSLSLNRKPATIVTGFCIFKKMLAFI